MTQRLTPHQPTPNVKSPELSEKQRIFDLLMVQRNVQLIFDEIADKEHIDSFLLKDVELTAGEANYVNHLLGRKYVSFTICGLTANATVWQDKTNTQADPTSTIALWCSADVTVDIIIF